MTNKKVIFLDFDGVLNNNIMFKKDYNNEFKGKEFPLSSFDSNCVKRVNEIIKATNANIVISSSWRLDSIENLKRLCDLIGLPTEFDRTPSMTFKRNANGEYYMRGDEIKAYLDKHKEIESYVILDDDCDMLEEQESNFVVCDSYTGITDENVKSAIEILNK